MTVQFRWPLGMPLIAHATHNGDDFGPLFNCRRAHPFFAVWLSLSFCPPPAQTDNQQTLTRPSGYVETHATVGKRSIDIWENPKYALKPRSFEYQAQGFL